MLIANIVTGLVSPSYGRWMERSPFHAVISSSGVTKYSPSGYAQSSIYAFPHCVTNEIEEYNSLVKNVVVWDAPDERPIEISGNDVLKLLNTIFTRDLSALPVDKGQYNVMVDHDGGMIGDTIVFRVGERRYWTTGDLGWIKGIATGMGFAVSIGIAEASPLQLQGPLSQNVAARLVGEEVRDLRRFDVRAYNVNGIPIVVSRTGFSGELGYELFLCDFSKAEDFWRLLFAAGEEFGLKLIGSSEIRRIEAGFCSAKVDYTNVENPFELGMGYCVHLDRSDDFVGKAALTQLLAQGIKRRCVGVVFDDPLLSSMEDSWPVLASGGDDGVVTSVAWSPHFEKSIGLAIIPEDVVSTGCGVRVATPEGEVRASISLLPFTPHRFDGNTPK